MNREPPPCTVCRSMALSPFAAIAGRSYWRCSACLATILDWAHHLAPTAEYAHYLHHRNDPADPRYRAFLARLATPLLAVLKPQSDILDYGCGPGPALACMFDEAGHRTRLYDPFFARDQAALARSYDAISCTEAAEHFHHPADEFDRLDQLLSPGGWLAIMTCFQTDDLTFPAWHYRQDPTHVVFYREETLHRIAGLRGWSCHSPVKDVALMQKPAVN